MLFFAVKMQGKQVMSELDFAAEILPKSVKILAVTGTNGKSTVVTFAGQVLHSLVLFIFSHFYFVIKILPIDTNSNINYSLLFNQDTLPKSK